MSNLPSGSDISQDKVQAVKSAARDKTKSLVRIGRFAAWLFLVAIVVLLPYALAIRPWFLRWGATDEEVQRKWLGDDLTPHARSRVTRAISIQAPADAVWPWIVQIGQDRGGFYSYTWLENLFGCEMHNAERIVPEFQHREVGDTVWMAPKHKYGGQARMIVGLLEPNRAMILVTSRDAESVAKGGRAPEGIWGFILDPLDERTTRLVMRSLGSEKTGVFGKVFDLLIMEPAHFIMERKMMLGIKQRAEAASLAPLAPSRPAEEGSKSMALPSESQVQSEVWQTVKKLNEVWTKGNPEILADYFHEKMVAITPSDRKRIEGGKACVAAWSAFAKSAKIHYFNETNPKVQIYGDAAVVTYYYDMSFERAGQTIHAEGRDMFVMVRQNGRWWAVADQFSPFPK